ncbi:hypothetical protein [Mesorhizobium sp. M1E.F.Ca.ET.045.02.1.1]|uniref:hypothetical protein n=1 Tax=Mesorhizobium sp. M1E.F.Ca.ET.045.02.1.1 TaxID=2493672 RepID=UPI001FE13BB0|nr:hypothetical protein [Mesorhizobium sp. M1E.F.Ca.ET.045.02.1.1]
MKPSPCDHDRKSGGASLDPIDFQDTDHFRMMRDFCSDPAAFLAEALYEDEP